MNAPGPQQPNESGFTIVEMIVVSVIVLILFAAAVSATRSAKHAARQRGMVAVAGSVDQAVASFNRMNPPVAGADKLIAANPNQPWDGSEAPATGLYSITAEPLLRSWPDSPYTGEPIRVYRYPVSSCPTDTQGVVGSIVICRFVDPARPALESAGLYHIRAFARGSDGAVKVVYDKKRG